MAVKIRETELVLSRRLEERSVEVTASGSLRLPSELPDAAAPIRWKALASVDRVVADAASGRLEARGTLRGWVVYTAAGSESPDPVGAVFGGRLEGELPFTASIDLPPDGGDAVWQARAVVRDVEGHFRTDGRTADVDVVLSVRFSGVVQERTAAVSQVSATAPDRVETTSATLRVNVFQGEGRTRLALEEAHGLDLPAGSASRLRILDLHVEPIIALAEPREGGVLVRGELAFELLYALQRQAPAETPAPEPPEPGAAGASSQAEIPAPVRLWDVQLASWTGPEGFETTIPIAGLGSPTRVRARARLADASVRVLPGEGLVYITCQVDVEAQAVDTRTVPVVADIRSAGPQAVEQRKVPLHLESPAGEGRRTFTGGATVELAGTLPPVERIVWSGAGVDAVSTRAEAGRVHVSASLTPWAYYLPYKPDARTSGVVFAFWPGAINLEQVVAIADLRPEAEIAASLMGLSVEADLISRQTVEFTVSGQCAVEAQLPTTQEVVAEAVAVRAQGTRQPSIYLVVTQPNDTLWKLARRYRTTPQQIQAANPDLGAHEETDPLPAGSRLFILAQ